MPGESSEGAVRLAVPEGAGAADTEASAPVVPAAPAVERRRRRRVIHEISYDESESRARTIITGVHARLGGGASIEVQERIGQLLGLIDDLRIPPDRGLLLAEVALALRQLSLQPPNLVIVDRTIEHLRARTRVRGLRFARVIVSASPHLVVAGGVMASIAIFFGLVMWGLTLIPRGDLLVLQRVTEAGFAGSLTSVMLRFNRWRGTRHFTTRDAFFEGLFRPFIGVFFAWMCYYFLEAGLLPFQPAPGIDKLNLFVAVAFAAGFSERLAASFVEGLRGRRAR